MKPLFRERDVNNYYKKSLTKIKAGGTNIKKHIYSNR
jgi:hypothetical protein